MGALIAVIILTSLTLIGIISYGIASGDKKVFLFTPLSLLWSVILLFAMFVQVGANQVGIVYMSVGPNKGIQETTLGEGLHQKSIFAKVTKVSTVNKTALLEVAGQTEDAIYADFQITLIYRVEGVDAGRFFKITGQPEIAESQLNSITKEALQSATINYDIYGVMGSELETVRVDFVNKLTTLMSTRYHLTVISASFDDIDAGPDIEAVIQEKARALQQIQIAEVDRQKAVVEALTAQVRANANAAVVLINANANAEAQITLNSVTVNAIQLMYLGQFKVGEDTATPAVYGYLTIQEVTKTILTQLYYDTWDGVLPGVVTDGSGLIINP